MKIKYGSNVMYGISKLDHRECIQNIKNGMKDGEQKQWYNNGQLFAQKYYINDVQEGEYKEWFSNGQLFKQICYHNGKLNGDAKRWHMSGQINAYGYFKDDKLDGESTIWHYNGKIWGQQYYNNGEAITKCKKEDSYLNDEVILNIDNVDHHRDKVVI